MICNMALWDRLIRFVLSVLILAYAVAGGPFWFWILGVYGLMTSGWGLCPAYAFFRIKTLR